MAQVRRTVLCFADDVKYFDRDAGAWQAAVVSTVHTDTSPLSFTVRLADGRELTALREYLHHERDGEGAAPLLSSWRFASCSVGFRHCSLPHFT